MRELINITLLVPRNYGLKKSLVNIDRYHFQWIKKRLNNSKPLIQEGKTIYYFSSMAFNQIKMVLFEKAIYALQQSLNQWILTLIFRQDLICSIKKIRYHYIGHNDGKNIWRRLFITTAAYTARPATAIIRSPVRWISQKTVSIQKNAQINPIFAIIITGQKTIDSENPENTGFSSTPPCLSTIQVVTRSITWYPVKTPTGHRQFHRWPINVIHCVWGFMRRAAPFEPKRMDTSGNDIPHLPRRHTRHSRILAYCICKKVHADKCVLRFCNLQYIGCHQRNKPLVIHRIFLGSIII